MPEASEPNRGSIGRLWIPRILVVLVSAGVGAAFMFIALRRNEHPKPLATAPEKFVPAQTLRLLDGRQEEFGELSVGTDGLVVLNLVDARGHALLMYTTGKNSPMFALYGVAITGRKHVFLNVLTEPEPTFMLWTPEKHLSTESKGWNRDSLSRALLKWVYHSVFREKPETTAEKMIPSEDIRLVDRERHTFAVLGLSEAGEPSIALTNREGRFFAILAITEPGALNVGKPKEWPTLFFFDRHGSLRLMLYLGPEPEPRLFIIEKADFEKGDMGFYALDPQTGEEVSVALFDRERTAIPWLAHPMFRVTPPMILVDQRGSILW